MYKKNKILGVIPARGGSKGIKLKNIAILGGKPLIQYTIDQCHKSNFLTKFIVSTDNEKIYNISNDLGAKVVKRPESLAKDSSRTEECLLHAISELEKNNEFFDYIVILEPTSPFRKYKTIDESIKFLIDQKKDSLLTCKTTLENIGQLENQTIFKPLNINNPRRRQEREPLYIESSTVYVIKIDYLKKTKSIVSNNWLVKTIDPIEAIDINTHMDLEYARFMFNKFDKS